MTPEQEQLLLTYVKQVASQFGVDLSEVVNRDNLDNALVMAFKMKPMLKAMLGAYIHG